MSTQEALEAANGKFARVTSETLGREINADNYDAISATEAAALLKAFSLHPEFGQFALQHGTAFAQCNIFLNAKANGVSLHFDDIDRLSRGLPPLPAHEREQDDADLSADALEEASSRLTAAANAPPGETAADARARLAALSTNREWAAKALQHGTPEAAENLRLNLMSTGAGTSELDIQRMSRGYVPSAEAPPEHQWQPPSNV